MKFLLVGLGNPGTEYANTRHNIGFDVVHAFATKHGGKFREDRLAYVAEAKYKARVFICVCPTTFMNLSGRAFKYWMEKEKIPLEHTLTVLDDLSIPLDKLRMRSTGSSGGHNGLKDIEAVLGTQAYPKLRFGIGSTFPKGMQSDFVLGKWLPGELAQVRKKIEGAVEAIEQFSTMGTEKTMSLLNQRIYVAD